MLKRPRADILPVAGPTPHNTSAVYKSLYTLHSNSTPVFQNVSGQEANPLVRALQSPKNSTGAHALLKRDELPVGTCAPGTPCVNGACCSNKEICGFSPDECGTDTCISNCDAKAECGQYAPSESATALSMSADFCEAGCQKDYGGCGAVDEPSCGAGSMGRTIGASTRSCDKRLPSDIDIEPLTHLNFAFAFFHPTTFQVLPMSAGDEALYPQFTALKSKKPSLKTWIAVGGWSFNDATNSPNTQTAFSDMAGSAANRQMFIASLRHFMQTWGFDGVDIDWEYPGADDRGGIDADTANFVKLVRDMKDAFGGEYGISITLPASYWYLRGFDLQGMAAHVDFFNIMTYDIHGVWDAENKHTGPYVRPHTNITEIKQGLDLLWRNDVDPAQVNFGLGWYGRSFTLKDPSCNKPDCIFAYSGKAGECTKSSGTLSNAEIQRVIAKHGLAPTVDADAMVKWITWDSDQWMKINEASKLCLGGVLIWAVDQDGEDHTSSNDLMGVGTANGVSAADAKAYREAKQSMERGASISNSCYWTFCGDQCASGFSEQAYAKGQVPHIDGDVSCSGDDVRNLCCAPGTSVGTCSCNGWTGVGMPCATEYCPSGSELIAMNTNSYVEDSRLSVNNNLTCNSSAQSFCCSGFVPSQIANTDRLSLLGDPRRIPAETTDLALDTRDSDDGAKSHGFQNDVVGRLGQGAAGIGMEQHKPSEPDSPENVATPNKEKEKAGEWTKVKYGKDEGRPGLSDDLYV
ncbi:glycoside hydrolase superfamily [Aspergillus cavernicola]|uniref:chitinase n=1 Tax=Aspergillus cavernicola TaxID=176166 RepID=A0ABR4HAN7_9EURO